VQPLRGEAPPQLPVAREHRAVVGVAVDLAAGRGVAGGGLLEHQVVEGLWRGRGCGWLGMGWGWIQGRI